MKIHEDIRRIKNLMGILDQSEKLLSEQQSGQLVNNEVYDAIKNIEKVFSYADPQGNIIPANYKGNDKESNIKSIIKSTIGLDYWNKLSDLLKAQIYAFMFQSDSGEISRLRWLAGLAQAIDSKFVRSSIIDKNIKDPNVVKAIKIVRDAVDNESINKIYDRYLAVLDQQYKGIKGTPNDDANYKKIWQPRPKALEKLLNGESWDSVKKWWYEQIGEEDPQKTTSTPSKTTTKSTQNYVLTVSGKNFGELNEKFKNKFDNRLQGVKHRVEEMELTENGDELFLKITLIPDPKEGSSRLRFLGNPKSDSKPYRSIDSALKMNPNSKVLKTGEANLSTNKEGKKEDFEFHILGLD